MKSLESVSKFFYKPAAALFLVRLVTGYIFLEHGLGKVTNLTMPIGMMQHMLGSEWGWVGIFIAWLEVVGGAALMLGILTRVFAVAFMIQMIVAVFLTGFARGLQAHDLEIILALNSAALALAGGGACRLFHMFEHGSKALLKAE